MTFFLEYERKMGFCKTTSLVVIREKSVFNGRR